MQKHCLVWYSTVHLAIQQLALLHPCLDHRTFLVESLTPTSAAQKALSVCILIRSAACVWKWGKTQMWPSCLFDTKSVARLASILRVLTLICTNLHSAQIPRLCRTYTCTCIMHGKSLSHVTVQVLLYYMCMYLVLRVLTVFCSDWLGYWSGWTFLPWSSPCILLVMKKLRISHRMKQREPGGCFHGRRQWNSLSEVLCLFYGECVAKCLVFVLATGTQRTTQILAITMETQILEDLVSSWDCAAVSMVV